MICQSCGGEFVEWEMEESHDVPRYLFEGNPKGRKNKADKYCRHWLCIKCHKEYEGKLRKNLIAKARLFGEEYF